MPNPSKIVINTGPIIALVSGLGDLNILQRLYEEVLVPLEVCQELEARGPRGFAVEEFNASVWLSRQSSLCNLPPLLLNSLDRGEASVIQLALDRNISTVCIDETAGRRVARLNNLNLTGSIGILLRAHRELEPFSMEEVIQRMQARGIWLSQNVISFALEQAESH